MLTDELKECWSSFCRGRESFPRDVLYLNSENMGKRSVIKTFEELCRKALTWFGKFGTFIGILSHKQINSNLLDVVWLDLDADKVQKNVEDKGNPYSSPLEVAFEDVHKIWSKYSNAVVNFSAGGFHTYIPTEEVQLKYPKQALRNFVSKLETELELQTVDMQSVEPKRMMRAPYTINVKKERHNLMCIPIKKSWSLNKILREAQTCSEIVQIQWKPEPIADELKELDVKPKRPERPYEKTSFKSEPRLCIQRAIFKKMDHGKGHSMRLAVVAEHLANGCSTNEIVDLFRFQKDFDIGKTDYFVNHAKRIGYDPFTCENIMQLGYCLGEECPIFVPHMIKNPEIVERFRIHKKEEIVLAV